MGPVEPRAADAEAEGGRDAVLFEELKGIARRSEGPPAIPGYQIEAELSRGGQGVVYRARQEATRRPVALKVLPAGSAASARERRRFEREVELASRLAHPNIVTVFDSGVADGAPWYAMELVEGETLDAFVARTQPPTEERLRLFLELCRAVAHAHRAGVLHRDLKPGNVLVDGAGRVRVLDFGTAVALEGGWRGRATAPGEFLGTLAYAPPERIAAGERAPDTRGDVYALGVVLYELLTGHLPFDARGSLSAVVETLVKDAPIPPERFVPRLDRDLSAILAAALEKDPERRTPSVEALERDLVRHLAHEPIEARPRRSLYVLSKALRRHRRALSIATLVAGAAAILLVVLVRERWRAERARQDAGLVRAVVEDLLRAADPQRMGGDARLLDALALAAREIETTLEEAPDAQAALELALGDTYRRLLMSREAEQHLRAALARFRARAAPPLELARCLDLLGLALTQENRPEAVALQEEALALRRAALPPGDPAIAESERGLARALMAQLRDQDLTRARTLLESALATQTAAFGTEHVEVAETETVLARLELWTDSGAAGPRLERALATFDRAGSGDRRGDPRVLDCLTEYALLLQTSGRFDEAEALLERAASLTERLYGDELATGMMRRFADLRWERGDAAGAEELTRRALAHELESWAERRPDEAEPLHALAAELLAGRTDGRVPPYAAAFGSLRRFQGDGAFELAQWANGIALTLRAQDRTAETEPLLREALNIRCRAWGGDCPVRQRTLFLLASGLHEEGRTAEARSLLAESVRIADVHSDGAEETRALCAACCATGKEEP